MVSRTDELALEEAIEQSLLEDDFKLGRPKDFDPKYAIDTLRFWHFLSATQPNELKKLQRYSDWKLRILERLDRVIKRYGILKVLKGGLQVEDANFTMFYESPLPSSGETVKKNFASNEFSITRQVTYNQKNLREEIDVVIFLNGLPLSSLELKNQWTGQNARVHGIRQYKADRDPRQTLLNFGRCLVHFAVDTDEVYMTTKLDGNKTHFLPFNKGNNCGKGNPPNPNGHKTAYLWEEILTRRSIANVIEHFVRFDGKASDQLHKRTLFFPRYHQLDVVRKILTDVSEKGVGQTYLIQHSAGSGKSNSITWVAFQLIGICPAKENIPGFKSLGLPLFDSVIVVTDRRLLDKQLKDNIKDFSEVKNIVAPANSSAELREHLELGKKIITTTIQKFPFIVDAIADLSEKRFAVIIDEAHSSQGGTTAGKMNESLGVSEDPDIEDYQEKVLKAIKKRKMKGNVSYLAFTATPKHATLERFGDEQPDGSFKPFHLYSMKQAIEEGFILDVLANYTTYRSFYEIEKSIQENPLFDSVRAQKKLKAYVERDKRTITTKAEIMLDHFITKVFNVKKLRGKAKAMVVTQNIESAVNYYFALKMLLIQRGNPFKILIAFSGKKEVNGIEHSEAGLNNFPDKDTRDKFDENEYRILVVANKYLTGFDQPKLCTMYIDKKLQDVLAVQAISRLNRSAPKLGKKTEDLFVLDFFNSADDMKDAFDPFYTATTLSKATNVDVLHDLKDALNSTGVYEWAEVEEFIKKYFNNADAQELSPIIDTAAQRFNVEFDLNDNEKADFKIKAKQFVKIYAQMSAIIPFEIADWEKLFWFLKFLIPKLIVKSKEDIIIDELLESVDLSTYGLKRTRLNQSIELKDEESVLDPQNPNLRGVHDGGGDKEDLDQIIKTFNERHFAEWDATPEDQKIKLLSLSRHVTEHPDYVDKVANNFDAQTRELALKKIFDDVMTKQRKQELDLYRLYVKDNAFNQALFDTMKQVVYNNKLSAM